MNAVFYLSAFVAVIATIMVITRVNAVHALLYFIVSLLSVAVIFFVLGAPFIAALEVIIYAGAIMVLFVFVIMLLNIGSEAAEKEKQLLSPQAWTGPASLAAVLLGELIYVLVKGGSGAGGIGIIGPRQVGVSLLTKYVIGVELASMLLLAGLVGAYHLGRRYRKERRRTA
ncbi:MAG: NADH-quinone oxidoreductase subunit J [Nitrospiraceae bacterium]|nr:NADH-quinone oxidoreductase subunit J [Nitrospiraceae bacterium]